MPGEKTEKASDKKRRDERKKGNIFQSQDLSSALVLLGVFGTLKALGPSFGSAIESGITEIYGHIDDTIAGPNDMRTLLGDILLLLAKVMLPLFAASIAVSMAATFAQTRFLVVPSQVAPKFERVSILQGFKKMFSLKSVVEMVKSLLKISLLIIVIFMDAYPQMSVAMRIFDAGLPTALSWISSLVIDVALKAGVVLLVIGVADYFFQWWDYERNIMMSKQEVKDEYKITEGNPEVKSHIRSIQRRMARMRMMQAVPQADVVVKNPTHFAVALQYRGETEKAPVVVAKGRDAVALRIIQVAEENGVFVTENRPLAQALYKSVEIGAEIPADFYKAVAEILAYLYKLKKAGRA